MLTISQLSDAIQDVALDRIDLYAFERWLRRESKNVRSWGEEPLIQAVFSIESVLSEFRFAEMPEAAVKEELANAIRPFVGGQAGAVSWQRIESIGKIHGVEFVDEPQIDASTPIENVPRKPLASSEVRGSYCFVARVGAVR